MRRAHGLQRVAVLTLLLPAAALGQEPAAKPKLDAFGDPLPAGAIARCGTMRYRHAGQITSITYSPDGKLLAAIAHDGVRLFNAADGKLVRSWPQLRGIMGTVVFSRNGRSLFATDFFRCHELNVADGSEVRTIEDQGFLIRSVDISSNGKLLAIAGEGKVSLVDPKNGEAVRALEGHSGNVNVVRFSSDGLKIATGGDDKTLRIWDADSGKEIKKIGLTRAIGDLTFSPDGTRLMVAEGHFKFSGAVSLFNAQTGEKIQQLTGALFIGGYCVAYSPNGRDMATGEADGTIRLYNAENGSLVRKFKERENTLIAAVCFSPDGKSLASAGIDSAIQIWDTATGKSRNSDQGHLAEVTGIAFASDGKSFVTGSLDSSVRSWDATTGAPVKATIRTLSPLRAVGYLDDHTLAVVSHEVTFLDPNTGKSAAGPRARRIGPPPISQAALSVGGKYLVVAGYGTEQCLLSETTSGKELCRLGENKRSMLDFRALAVSSDGKIVATATWDPAAPNNATRLRIWDSVTGKKLHDDEQANQKIEALEFAPDGLTLFVAAGKGRLQLWSAKTAKPLEEWTVPDDDSTHALAISPDCRTVAAGAENGTVRTFERLTGTIRRTLPGHLGEVKSLRFSADSRLLVSGSADSTALVWRMSSDESEEAATVQALDAVWNDLQSSDAALAERSIWRLASADATSIAAFQSKLPRVPAVDAERIKALIADLNSDKFATRQQAEANLAKLGTIAQSTLQSAIDGKLSSEQRDRIKGLLARLDAIPTGETLGALRAVEALEHNASADARRVLDALAAGSAGPRVAASAKESLERMGAIPTGVLKRE